jgi:hypothetical protein
MQVGAMHPRFDPQLVLPGTTTLTLPLHGTQHAPVPQCKSALGITEFTLSSQATVAKGLAPQTGGQDHPSPVEYRPPVLYDRGFE